MMFRSWPRWLAGLTLAALASAVPTGASATVMEEISLDEMTRAADAIVYAEVVSSGVRMVIPERGDMVPETITTLRVIEWLGGSGEGRVTLRELGGEWQGGGLHYEGTPRYHRGERVVVFLERRPEAPHDYRTFAMAQGKFIISLGVPGVPDSVRRDLDGIAFARWADGRQTITEPGVEPAIELESFLATVRALRGATDSGADPVGGAR